MQATVFRPVGQGRVDGNKEPYDEKGNIQKIIEISPTEWTGMRDGERTQNASALEYETQDVDGQAVKGSIPVAGTIKATWLPGAANRLTPPDVRRGMRVEILQSSDDDSYWWRYHGLDDNLMKLETIVIGISNTTKEGDTTLRPDNMYWIEMSTHRQVISISTSKSNGEAYKYEAFIDAKNGLISINDDVNNVIEIVSKEKLVRLENTDGTFVKLDKKDIKFNAPQDVLGKVGRDFTCTVGRNMSLTIGENFTMKAGTSFLLDGGGSTIKGNSGNITITSPTVDINQ